MTRAYVYTAVKRPCTRHVHVRVHGQYTVVYMVRSHTRPCTRAETARYAYTCLGVQGHVHGRVRAIYTAENGTLRAMYMVVYTSHTQPCTCSSTRAVYTARTWPCTGPVYGAVYAPCTRPKTSVQTTVHSHVHGWCRRAVCTAHTWPCTGLVYGTAVIRPCTGRFRGRRRVHGSCTRPPCNGHTTRYTAAYTACTQPHNGRLHGRGRPVHRRVTAV